MIRGPQNQIRLEDLPVELLAEVSRHLDWTDQMSMLYVSKKTAAFVQGDASVSLLNAVALDIVDAPNVGRSAREMCKLWREIAPHVRFNNFAVKREALTFVHDLNQSSKSELFCGFIADERHSLATLNAGLAQGMPCELRAAEKAQIALHRSLSREIFEFSVPRVCNQMGLTVAFFGGLFWGDTDTRVLGVMLLCMGMSLVVAVRCAVFLGLASSPFTGTKPKLEEFIAFQRLRFALNEQTAEQATAKLKHSPSDTEARNRLENAKRAKPVIEAAVKCALSTLTGLSKPGA